MKAISIQQPWAWLITHGHKDIENRTWPTRFRGRILIHAGKKFDEDGYYWIRDNFPDIDLPGNFDLGGIVGETTIVDCVKTFESRWFFGLYGFVLKDSVPKEFIPARGQLGIFDWKGPVNHAEGLV